MISKGPMCQKAVRLLGSAPTELLEAYKHLSLYRLPKFASHLPLKAPAEPAPNANSTSRWP